MIREAESEPSREELIALIGALRAENASLKARIAELERRLGLNSSNSGKPPSSDGLKKPVRVKSLREGTGKQRGGQKGHKGETLRQVTDPDDVVDHYPSACSCGAGLGPDASVGHTAKAWLVSLTCRKAKDLGYPHELWTTRLLARHARAHGPAEGHACLANLAQGTVCKILDQEEVKPHKVRYYLEQRDPGFGAIQSRAREGAELRCRRG